jgi:hypothetical protein
LNRSGSRSFRPNMNDCSLEKFSRHANLLLSR